MLRGLIKIWFKKYATTLFSANYSKGNPVRLCWVSYDPNTNLNQWAEQRSVECARCALWVISDRAIQRQR
jgi:hypothetical protein